MDINIAFDTIIYIMIFVFPGLLFRKSVFIKEHSKQFHQGNLLERMLFMIFLSLIIILITILLVLFLKKIFDIKLIDSFSVDNIILIADTLINENIPQSTDKDYISKIEIFKKIFYDLATVLSLVYIISLTLGYTVYLALNKSWFSKLGIVRVNNYWESIIKGSYKYEKNNGTKYIRTDADILFNDSEEKVIYSGEVQDYFLSSKEYQLETIILKNPKIKKNKKYEEIPGHNFCIDKENILNINFSYIYVQTDDSYKNKIIDTIFSIINIIVFALSIVLTYKEYDNIHFNYLIERIIFGFNTFMILLIILNIIKLKIKNKLTKKILGNSFIITLLFSLNYLWLFDFFEIGKIMFFQVIISSIVIKLNPIKKDLEDSLLDDDSNEN